jgi:hypothetical protein
MLSPWHTPLAGQDPRGSIVGRITDTSGAVIPNAPVDVLNKAMGARTSLTTNEAGFYQATYLLPGAYQITVELAGFKKFLRDGIEVRVNDRIEVNISLEVGAAEQSITVTEETPLLNTATASIGQVVDGRRISDMPVPHGNPYFLIGLAAGVAFTRDGRLDRPFEPTHIVGFAMDGTRANRSDVTLDGAPSTATANPNEVIASYVPPADVIAEFKVQTATFDASFGQTEGGVTNISIKSGTNAFHGSAYYVNMTPALFANDFFANANRIPRTDFTYNRWGASFGGPVRLPKLYDGRNKTFFMWGYEGILEDRPRNDGTPTVPTEAMKNGNFSALLALGSNYQIYNPFTRRSIGGGRYQQDPFTGNIIPASLFSPVARKVLDQYYPNPLTAGNADGTNNYLRPDLVEHADYATHTIRVDHAISERNRLFGRVSWYDRDSNYNNYFNNIASGQWFKFISRAGVLDDVITLTPTTVLNFRYGYNRFIRVTDSNPGNHGFDLTSLGFPAAYNDAISPDIRRFPRFDITGYQGTGVGGEYRPNDIHSLYGPLQKSIGAHLFKFGTEFRSYRETDGFFANDQTGRFNFDSTWTRGPLDNSPTAPGQLGQSVASFLLGLPASSNSFVQRAADYAEQSTAWGFFVHDDWKVNSRLTLNLGLRWDFETPMTERYNRSVRGLDLSYIQPFEAQARANYALNPTPEVPVDQFQTRGGLTFAGINGQPRGLYETPKANLMPRFGFAYTLNNKTVVRGGYGMFYGFLGQRRGDVIQDGFSQQTPLIPSMDNGLNFIATLSNPFPNGILEPQGAAGGAGTFVGRAIRIFNEKPLMPYMQRWQLGVQRELRGGFVAELSYVGNRGTHVEMNQNLNVTPQQYLSSSQLRDTAAINYLSFNRPNPFYQLLPSGAISGLVGTNIARERLLRPYPQFDTVTGTRYDGYSWYHSMQFQMEKRFSKGYTIQGNYTFSKFMQAMELMAQDDPRPMEVLSDLDRPHRLALSGIYELPFGRGRAFFPDIHPAASVFCSGWQVGGIWTYQSGAPINWNVSNIGNISGVGLTSVSPNAITFVGNVADIALPADQQTVSRWFNTGAGFITNSALQIDTSRQVRAFPLRFGFIRSDNVNNYDLSVSKNTRIREGINLQFKAEFLNAFNHPLYPVPTNNQTNPANAAFGQVIASTQANYPRRIQLNVKLVF